MITHPTSSGTVPVDAWASHAVSSSHGSFLTQGEFVDFSPMLMFLYHTLCDDQINMAGGSLVEVHSGLLASTVVWPADM